MSEAVLSSQPSNQPFHTNFILSAAVCILAGCFYLYEFILQVAPAVMTHELMRDLSVDAVGLGSIAAFYYLAYTPMQVPAGLLFDRFGPRALLALATFVCALGAIFFGVTHGAGLASVGRACMGFGSSFAFIGALVLLTRWFPPSLFALLAGVVQLMSSIGAITGEAPLAIAVQTYGWRSTTFWLGIAGMILALAIWLIVRDKPEYAVEGAREENNASLSDEPKSELTRLKEVCRNSQTWTVGLYSYLNWWPVTIFAALWGVPFLMQLHGISAAKAANACSMVWLGIGIGSPLVGWWSDKIGRRVLPLAVASVLGVISTVVVIYLDNVPFILVYVSLFIFGLAASGQSLSFALVRDNNSPSVVGTAIGFNNMAVVLGGVFQSLIGVILQLAWDGNIINGVHAYSTYSYRLALSIIPICYIISALLCLKGLRESHCKDMY
ncbi:MAG: MFS transporter [Gammaproteobacteria bacterium]